jgi:peptidoglycan/xylan/chitin deacetylase (PgdA/CDA1 family)
MIEPLLWGSGVGAAGWFSLRYAWWRSPVAWERPRVLMYHMERPHPPGTPFNKLRVPPDRFARQIGWLSRHGFSFVFASQLFSGEPLPVRSVCLTFDDGYEDNLSNADPVLARYGARATLYLVAERDGGWSSKKKRHHSDEELQSEPKLSDEQVRRMIGSGRWELGGHTRTHAHLPALDERECREEIGGGREEFGRAFGTRPETFAYPFGLYRAEHAEMVREAGFVGAVTTEAGIAPRPYDDPMQVPRIKVAGNDDLLGFLMKLRGGKRGLLK